MQLRGGLIACDHCGAVALDTPRFGWKRYLVNDEWHHHCTAAAEQQEHIRSGLVYKMNPATATTYEPWNLDGSHPDDPPAATGVIEGIIHQMNFWNERREQDE